MSGAYIIFDHMDVQRANCIAGFTYGFPSITHFLGFGHALSIELNKSHGLKLEGCAVICHQYQLHTYRQKDYGDYVFAQTKNPPREKGKDNKGREKAQISPPIVEEGKMNMAVSLIMECPNFIISRQTEISELKNKIISLAFQHHLAGGSIQQIRAVHIHMKKDNPEDHEKQTRQIKRMLLPGFVLMDRSELLLEKYQKVKQNNPDAELIDTWLDFSAIKYQAKPLIEENVNETEEEIKTEWVQVGRSESGWLVPITKGYKAIAPLCQPGEVANARDPNYPFCFVEAVHSLGEWRSLHRILDISATLWRYHYEPDWYLCRQVQLFKEEAIIAVNNNFENEIEDDFLNSL
jgi:CRISPR-associated protein Csy2